MSREQQVSSAFLALSDTFTAEFDPLSLFQDLVRRCVALLDISAAGVLLDDARGRLRLMASSSEEASLLEVLQLQTETGPCMECYRTGVPVSVPDLSAAAYRWPDLVPPALGYGYRSLYTVPLRLQGRVLGAVNFFRTRQDTLCADDRRLGQALADISAVALMHWSAEPRRPDDLLTRMQSVIAAKAGLEMAKGMVAQHADVSIAEAAVLLRDHSRRNRARLTDTVLALVGRTLPLDELAAPAATASESDGDGR